MHPSPSSSRAPVARPISPRPGARGTGGARVALAALAALVALVAALGTTGCGEGRERAAPASESAPDAREAPATSTCDVGAVVDDLGDTSRFERAPTRIVSLNPVTTELLFALGQADRLVGRSDWDTYPAEASGVPALGGAIRPNVEAVLTARPDVVVLYGSNDNRAAATQLRRAGLAVVSLKIDRIADFARAVDLLGRATCEPTRARTLRDSVLATIARVRAVTAPLGKPTVVWPVGTDPLLVVGRASFQQELLDAAGARNAFADLDAGAPQVSAEELLARDPDVLLVSPDSVRADVFARSARWRALRAVREGRLLVYDTALVLRPSVNLGAAAVSLARLLHPEAADRLPPLATRSRRAP